MTPRAARTSIPRVVVEEAAAEPAAVAVGEICLCRICPLFESKGEFLDMCRIILFGVMAVLLVPALCLGAEFEANNVAEIQAALDTVASNGEDDTIRIAAGTYVVDTTLTFVSTEEYSLRVEGQGRGVTILDGGGQTRVMAVDTVQTASDYWTSVTMSGVSFINGRAEDGGGGLSVLVYKADVLIDGCGFENNVAEPPEESYLGYDRMNGGGGLFIGTGNLLRKTSGDVHVQKSEFINNHSSVFGGGAYVYAKATFHGNVIIEQNIFKGNSAELDGAGLWVGADDLDIINNTFLQNNSGDKGGGLYELTSVWLDIHNNIFWDNDAANGGGDLCIRSVMSYAKTFSNILPDMLLLSENTHSEGANLDEDPLLGDDLTPLPGSPCINTGDNDAPELGCGDHNGHTRIHDGTVDRGAIEFGSTDSADPNCGDTDPNNPADPNNPIPTPPSIDGGGGGGGCFLGTAMTVDPDSEVYKAARRVTDRHNSPSFKAAMEKVRQEVRPLIKKQCRQLNQDAAINARDQVDLGRPELLVFVSASMPPDTTMALAWDAHRIKDKSDVRFVLRGFPECGLTDYVKSVRANNNNLNLTVDPFLYDTYEVKQVPAVVVNRAVKIDHPRNLKTALTRIQAASDQNLKPLIKDLNW